MLNSDIGLEFDIKSVLPFLNTGIILAVFILVGTFFQNLEKYYRCIRVG